VTRPSGAVQRAEVVTMPVCRSIDWRQFEMPGPGTVNVWPFSEKVRVDQVGMLARCCTLSDAFELPVTCA
jgi:hypothetical protein